jgi:DNA-binding transcriptional LysR family regulator
MIAAIAGSRLISVPNAAAVSRRSGAFRDHDWIGNSRNRADEDVVRILASMTGFEPRVAHRADSLELVEDLILSGMGVGLLPADRPSRPGVATLPLGEPEVRLRAFAHTRRGRSAWPPLRLVLDRLSAPTDA